MGHRILFFGNTGNIGFRFSTWLRKKGYEVNLFYPKDFKHERSLPEWENPLLKDCYPDWIRFSKKSRFPFFMPSLALKKKSNSFDVILTTGEFVIPALCLKKPVIFIPVGGDLTELPFLFNNFKNSIRSLIYKRRIKSVNRILTAQEDCFWASKFLGVYDKVKEFPIPLDCDSIRENYSKSLSLEVQKKYSCMDYIFFNPSRKNMDPKKFSYKGNEKFLLAFKKLLKVKANLKIKGVIGLHGHHTKEFQSLVTELGLDRHIEYINHLSKDKLHAYMKLDNVIVFDQFGNKASTNLGGVSRESLAMGAPVVASAGIQSLEFERNYGKNCPLIFASSKEEIYESMIHLVSLSKNEFVSLKNESLLWAKATLDWNNQIQILIDCIEDAMIDASFQS